MPVAHSSSPSRRHIPFSSVRSSPLSVLGHPEELLQPSLILSQSLREVIGHPISCCSASMPAMSYPRTCSLTAAKSQEMRLQSASSAASHQGQRWRLACAAASKERPAATSAGNSALNRAGVKRSHTMILSYSGRVPSIPKTLFLARRRRGDHGHRRRARRRGASSQLLSGPASSSVPPGENSTEGRTMRRNPQPQGIPTGGMRLRHGGPPGRLVGGATVAPASFQPRGLATLRAIGPNGGLRTGRRQRSANRASSATCVWVWLRASGLVLTPAPQARDAPALHMFLA